MLILKENTFLENLRWLWSHFNSCRIYKFVVGKTNEKKKEWIDKCLRWNRYFWPYLTYTVPVIMHAERLPWRVPAPCISYKKKFRKYIQILASKLKILIWMIKYFYPHDCLIGLESIRNQLQLKYITLSKKATDHMHISSYLNNRERERKKDGGKIILKWIFIFLFWWRKVS